MRKVVVFVDELAVSQSVQEAMSARSDIDLRLVETEQAALSEIDGKTILLTNLPADTGLGFLRSVQTATQTGYSAPIIILTSTDNERMAVRALRDVATNYVPIRLIESELIGTIDSVFSVANAHQNRSRIMECITRWNSEFVLDNDRHLIPPLVRYFQESTQRMGLLCEPGEETRIGIALEEALLNSMYHGNLEVSSELREDDDSRFHELIEIRRHQKPYCERQLTVQVEFSREEAVFTIQDSGPGFDISKVPDPTDPNNVERVCGRGMLLMRNFMDEVEYNEVGNQVRMVKRRQTCDSR